MKRIVTAAVFTAAAIIGAIYLWWGAADEAGEGPPEIDEANAQNSEEPSIRGRVVDSAGEPIEGAAVETDRDGEARSDAQGRFRFEELEPGTHRVDARAEGFATAGPREMRRVEVVLSEEDSEAAVTDLELVLHRPATVSGKIVASGRPVEGAHIGIYYQSAQGLRGPLEPFSVDGAAMTDADGDFEIDEVVPGRLQLLVEADDHAFAESDELFVEPGEELGDVVIDLDPASSLVGEVVDTDGDPVAAEVVLRGDSLSRGRRVEADRGGAFSFRRLEEGNYRIEARAPDYRTELVDDIEVGSGEEAAVDVVMEAASGIFGRVVDPEGEPVEEAFVWLESSSRQRPKLLRTDEEGRFQWDEASEKSYTATAVSPHHEKSQTSRISAGSDETLELGEGGAVSGRVIGPDGAPVQSFSVGVATSEVDGPRPYRPRAAGIQKIHDSAGRFEIDSLRPGTYWFRARSDQHGSARSEKVVVRSGREFSGVTIRLGEAGRIVGRITDAETGQPVAGANVRLFEPDSPFSPNQTRTDGDGGFELDGVSPGRRSLRVAKKDYLSTVAAGIEVEPGSQTRRDVAIDEQKGDGRMQFQGIGAVLHKDGRGVRIREVLDDHPASEFGLESDDYIQSVDGEPVDGMPLSDVIERIRGQQGAPVEIEVERAGERLEVEIERGQVVVN